MRILETLAIFHYELGLIGHSEFIERIKIAEWLDETSTANSNDPRTDEEESEEHRSDLERPNAETEESVKATIRDGSSKTGNDDEDWLQFLCLGIWVFTKSDPDPYPSVPHGHYQNQNRKWPKLNPYTGRVFSAMQQEDRSQRLSKRDMKIIWKDKKFRSFCREMIVWYQEQHPSFRFGVRRPLRFPRW